MEPKRVKACHGEEPKPVENPGGSWRGPATTPRPGVGDAAPVASRALGPTM